MRKKSALVGSMVVFLSSVFGPFCAQADEKCPQHVPLRDRAALVQAVERRYAEIGTLQARFRQRSYFAGMQREVISEGHVRFCKPGMMNWVYEKPDPQQFVADGKILWFYQPDLNQVTVGPFQESFDSDLPVSFLLGVGGLDEKFELADACLRKDLVVLELIPRSPDPKLQRFVLEVGRKDHTPLGATIVDIGGNETTIRFEQVVLNAKQPEETFRFEIPLGTDVIERNLMQTQDAGPK